MVERSINLVKATSLAEKLADLYSNKNVDCSSKSAHIFANRTVSSLAQAMSSKFLNGYTKIDSDYFFSRDFLLKIAETADIREFRKALEAYKLPYVNEYSFALLREVALDALDEKNIVPQADS